MTQPRSPLAPAAFPDLPPIAGVTLRTARAGFKDWARDDFLLVTLAPGTTVAGVTTRSACPSPEVERCRAHLPSGQARAITVCAGNSNAFTGARGRATTDALVAAAAAALDAPASTILPMATGVIGVPMPTDVALRGLDAALRGELAGWRAAADAMRTTDTFAKGAVASAIVGGSRATVVGIAKGSGMIAPDMATMLALIATDAAVDAGLLADMLRSANADSFSCATVDGDTSTSDTVLLAATGAVCNAMLSSMDDPGADALAAAIGAVARDLAMQVVRDGEGARKFITIRVTGATSDKSAARIARSIADSPLVKTAIAGGDANWGRIVMAVGKAGEPADRDRLSIAFGGTVVASDGAVVPGYDEAPVARHLAGHDIDIAVDMGLGEGRARLWTCDLTHGYIAINADYRS